ncbi:pro-glucagon isoform X2 [Sphaerodactylus townsendi]|uniref:pro-glucagon isoform X2 n=1 Tax=Sphaerodactylus townsendi TaxID=933632 RepID=UPI0020273889|nr:pro-glucagon isoform X2 [Sphaerodactylus townsendi]
MKMKSMYFVAGLLLMIVQSSWQSALQETEEKSRQQRQEETEKENLLDQLSSNGLARRHAEYERHADGTYTSDISSYLEEKAAKEFIAWLMSGRGRRDLSEGTAKAVDLARRHSEGTYNSDLHELLDEMATQEFLKWLLEAKVTERDLSRQYQGDTE